MKLFGRCAIIERRFITRAMLVSRERRTLRKRREQRRGVEEKGRILCTREPGKLLSTLHVTRCCLVTESAIRSTRRVDNWSGVARERETCGQAPVWLTALRRTNVVVERRRRGSFTRERTFGSHEWLTRRATHRYSPTHAAPNPM